MELKPISFNIASRLFCEDGLKIEEIMERLRASRRNVSRMLYLDSSTIVRRLNLDPMGREMFGVHYIDLLKRHYKEFNAAGPLTDEERFADVIKSKTLDKRIVKEARINELIKLILTGDDLSTTDYATRLGVSTNTIYTYMLPICKLIADYLNVHPYDIYLSASGYVERMALIRGKYRWVLAALNRPEVKEINRSLEEIARLLMNFNVSEDGVISRKKSDDVYGTAFANCIKRRDLPTDGKFDKYFRH